MRCVIISLLVYLLVSIVGSPVRSEKVIYQWFEKNKAYFSDHPHANARAIKLPEQPKSHTKAIAAPDVHRTFDIKYVIDGDTIVFADETKVRLLGINTPEISNPYHHATEVGGKRAKQWLSAALKGHSVRLETDVETSDRYGRTLAHVFTDAGVHINLELVAEGLAEVSLYPPNLKYADKLIAAQTSAENQGLGIWGDPAYAVKTPEQLNNDNYQGWQRISGTVQNIRETRRNYYLEFSPNFSARISRSNVGLFPNLQSLVGQTIEVRGLVNRQEGQFSLMLRHPSALRL